MNRVHDILPAGFFWMWRADLLLAPLALRWSALLPVYQLGSLQDTCIILSNVVCSYGYCSGRPEYTPDESSQTGSFIVPILIDYAIFVSCGGQHGMPVQTAIHTGCIELEDNPEILRHTAFLFAQIGHQLD